MALVLALIVAKLLSTSVTLGSGGSGGMFAPTLFLGAMTGSAFGSWIMIHFPQLNISPGAFALVGMGAAMAGALFAPVTAVIMIFEVTNNYFLILPLMIASIVSIAIARRFTRDSVYTLALSRKGIRLHGGRDETLLRSMAVGEIMRRDFTTIHENWPMAKVFESLSRSAYSTLPVVDEKKHFVGILPFETLRQLINENCLSWLIIAKELLQSEVSVLRPEEDLREALSKFATQNVSELPVLEAEEPCVIGMLSRGDLLAAYNHALLRRVAGRTIFEPEPITFVPFVGGKIAAVAHACRSLLNFNANNGASRSNCRKEIDYKPEKESKSSP
jgi:CIC family chloride channel protein